MTAVDLIAGTNPEPFSTSRTSNWVARVGGLPTLVQHVAHDLMEKGGRNLDESHAISEAIGIIHNWSHGHDGKGHRVSAAVVAEAVKAMAEWAAKRAAAHALATSPDEHQAIDLAMPAEPKDPKNWIGHRLLALARHAIVADHLVREPTVIDASQDEGMDEPRILTLAGRRFLVTELAMPDTAERISAAKKGQALPGKNGGAPRFPIRNADELDKAIRAVGRARPNTEEERMKVRKFIISRAKALGLTSRLPDTWNLSDGSLKS